MTFSQGTDQFWSDMDSFVNRRIYQLNNWEEVYKGYAVKPDFKYDIATLELELILLCNEILLADLTDSDSLEELKVIALDTLYGKMDEVAVGLMARCDTTKKLGFVDEQKD